MSIPIKPADVALRAGLVGASGYQYNVLPRFIDEPYNHAGLAISETEIHHVESHGYETVSVESFFSGDKAAEGAIIRFVGPQELAIRQRVVKIAKDRAYRRIPGNPFSSADDLRTVNCNEFIHELFRQAIRELLTETRTKQPGVFRALAAEYTNAAGQIPDLIAARNVEFTTYDLLGAGAVVRAAEVVGRTQVDNPDVRVQFEGQLQMRNLYPDDWARSWNPFTLEAYQEGFYTVAVLHTYTPNSFVNSKYFKLVEKVRRP